jgi:lysophospholipase L1-like esterase
VRRQKAGLALAAAGLMLLTAGEWLLRLHHRRQALRLTTAGLRPETAALDAADRLMRPALRLVALGDSITHGMDLPLEATYPYRLARRLEAYLDGRPVVVVNAGVCGDTVLQGLARLERDVLRFRPALTLVAFGLNDASLCRNIEDARREAQAYPRGPAALLARLHLYKTSRAWLARLARRLGLARQIGARAEPMAEPRVSPAAFCWGLRTLVTETRRATRGQVVLLTTHAADLSLEPQMRQRQAAMLKAYNAMIRETAAALGAGLIDVERTLAGGQLVDLLEPDGVHLNAAGQAVLADIIADKLISAGYVS